MGQAERTKGATWVQALWHLSDLLAMGGGFLLGYHARFHSLLIHWLPPDKGIPPLSLYLTGAAVSAVIWIPLFHAAGLYQVARGRPRHRGADILRVQALGMLIVAALSFFYREASFSRVAVPIIWLLTFLLTLLGREAVAQVVRRWPRLRPIRFAVVGRGPTAERLIASLARSSYPHQFAGYFASPGDPGARAGSLAAGGGMGRGEAVEASEAGTLGEAAELAGPALRSGLDLIVLAAPADDPAFLARVRAQCQEADLDFLFVPELFSLWGHPVRVEEVEGLPVMRLRDLPLAGWNGVWKRSFDLAVSALLLLLLSPVFFLLALAVRLDSRGPVFHRQERIGRDRRSFEMLKFRSMRVDAEASTGPVWAGRDDPRRTRVGAWLRRWSLDELPQLWNVLRGEMSLVGPRPERPFFVHQFEGQVADYYDRHRVKSGLTGWAQVHGLRGDTPIAERTRYDLYYVEHWSIWLDLRILALTALAVVRHQGD